MPIPQFDEIRIENTNRCGYRCWFCPREKMTRQAGVMPVELFYSLVQKLPDHSGRVDLHGYGEPLLDHWLTQKVSIARERWPKARLRIITTLGIHGAAAVVQSLVEAGLTDMEVSIYGADRESYKRTHGVDRYDLVTANLEKVRSLQMSRLQLSVRRLEGADAEPEKQAPQPVLEQTSIRRGELHNYGNGRSFNEASPGATCSVAWGYRRRVLQITYDLNVIPCCFDSNATVVLGNLHNQSLSDVFDGEAYRNFIEAHLKNSLDKHPVCKSCEKCLRP